MDLWETAALQKEESQNQRYKLSTDKENFWTSESELEVSEHILEYRKLSKTYNQTAAPKK